MATLASSPPQSPSWPKRRPRAWALRCERYCCLVASYFPLAFVYGVTTWAVYVEASLGLQSPSPSWWIGYHSTIVGVTLYLLLNASYTVAVFTDPGSPSSATTGARGRGGRQHHHHQYSALPVTERADYTVYTVNSTGGSRYCKKCQCPKPDRTHHCSTCKRCVLKMDHHCPWLATCVGLYNYKAFLLFLIYTSLFCWVCFFVAALWVWDEIAHEAQYLESFLPVNVVLLAIVGGIIGLVLTGFTGWHISLAVRGMTTIECLEKTRYVSPLRKAFERYDRAEPHYLNGGNGDGGGDGFTNGNDRATRDSLSHRLQDYTHQIIDAHANAIPGVTRAEEGEERISPTPERFPPNYPQQQQQQQNASPYFDHSAMNGTSTGPDPTNGDLTPAQVALQRSYADLERQRERNQYREYQDEEDNERLPRAFDLGWRRNLLHLFGPQPLLWPFPVCTTTGDGWHWEASEKFFEARERLRRKREQELAEEQDYYRDLYQRNMDNGRSWLGEHHHHQQQQQQQQTATSRHHSGSRDASAAYGRERPSSGVSMKTLRPMSPRPRPGDSDYEDDDEEMFSSSSSAAAEPSTKASVNGDGSQSSPRRSPVRREEESDEWRDWE